MILKFVEISLDSNVTSNLRIKVGEDQYIDFEYNGENKNELIDQEDSHKTKTDTTVILDDQIVSVTDTIVPSKILNEKEESLVANDMDVIKTSLYTAIRRAIKDKIEKNEEETMEEVTSESEKPMKKEIPLPQLRIPPVILSEKNDNPHEIIETNREKAKSKNFKCIFCQKGLKTVQTYKRHIQTYYKDNNEYDQTVVNTELERLSDRKVSQVLECKKCTKKFSTEYQIGKHKCIGEKKALKIKRKEDISKENKEEKDDIIKSFMNANPNIQKEHPLYELIDKKVLDDIKNKYPHLYQFEGVSREEVSEYFRRYPSIL
jgi:hypothetical protein